MPRVNSGWSTVGSLPGGVFEVDAFDTLRLAWKRWKWSSPRVCRVADLGGYSVFCILIQSQANHQISQVLLRNRNVP